jgi:hypothetical protein
MYSEMMVGFPGMYFCRKGKSALRRMSPVPPAPTIWTTVMVLPGKGDWKTRTQSASDKSALKKKSATTVFHDKISFASARLGQNDCLFDIHRLAEVQILFNPG